MQTVSYTRAFTQHDDFPQLRSAILSHSEPIVRSLVANSMQTVSHLLLSYSDDVLVPPLILARWATWAGEYRVIVGGVDQPPATTRFVIGAMQVDSHRRRLIVSREKKKFLAPHELIW